MSNSRLSEEEDENHANISFMYKTMIQRDPRKRRVKPVSKHLVDVDVDFGDSDEDSDFDIGQHADLDSDAKEDEDQEEVLELGAAQSSRAGSAVHPPGLPHTPSTDRESQDSQEEEEDCEDDEESEEEEDSPVTHSKGERDYFEGLDSSDEEDEDYVPLKKRKKAEVPAAKPKALEETGRQLQVCVDSPTSVIDQSHIKVLICSVCLSDKSVEEDEIVECDNCGVSVHEGCYGFSESQSVASTESSASTEPWFCDACKAGVSPHCELCPNSGGIYKETDTGRWVHVVCAMYTPGVAFVDVDTLCPVTLFEMPYNKWGAKECSLCEDARFSRTGVCISCDAGMCRSFFHVTCAQREGLLTEADPADVMDIADPFFAYCKQHVDKLVMKVRRRHWLAIQSHVRSYAPKVIDDATEQARFERKLRRHREKYVISRNKRPPSWVPTQKMVRHLHTSPHAVKAFMRKAELMGVVTHVEQTQHEKPEARKKPHITPGLSGEFIQYYFGRNTKIQHLQDHRRDLTTQNIKLREQEKVLRHRYDQLFLEMTQGKEVGSAVHRGGEKLWALLADMGGQSVTVPEMFRPKKRQRSPSKKETPCSPPALIHQCGICQQTTDQHLLTKCDSCHQHLHLGCLDPPLSRMPKKSKLFGWQCSKCVRSSSDDSGASVDMSLIDAPRRLREKENLREPVKFRSMQPTPPDPPKAKKMASKSRRKKKLAAMAAAKASASMRGGAGENVKNSTAVNPSSSLSHSKPSLLRSKKAAAAESAEGGSKGGSVWEADIDEGQYHSLCAVCNLNGTPSTTVRCDDCCLCYHFTCLDPPVKKSPKVRGYTWHCEACDPTDLSDEVCVINEEDDNDWDGA